MKLGWLNGALQVVAESEVERQALVAVFYGLGGTVLDLNGIDEGNNEDDLTSC